MGGSPGPSPRGNRGDGVGPGGCGRRLGEGRPHPRRGGGGPPSARPAPHLQVRLLLHGRQARPPRLGAEDTGRFPVLHVEHRLVRPDERGEERALVVLRAAAPPPGPPPVPYAHSSVRARQRRCQPDPGIGRFGRHRTADRRTALVRRAHGERNEGLGHTVDQVAQPLRRLPDGPRRSAERADVRRAVPPEGDGQVGEPDAPRRRVDGLPACRRLVRAVRRAGAGTVVLNPGGKQPAAAGGAGGEEARLREAPRGDATGTQSDQEYTHREDRVSSA